MKKVLLIILLLIPKLSIASFTRVQFVSGTGTSMSFPGVVSGNTLIFQVVSYAFPITSVNGDNGNTWVHATSSQCQNGTITEYADSFYVASATSGTTTATPISSATFAYEIGVEVSHTGPNFGFDMAGCASGSGTSSTLSLTTTYNNEILVSLIATSNGAVSSAPPSWTDFVTGSSSFYDGSANLLDAGTNGLKGAAFSIPSGDWVQTIISFHDDTMTGGGGGGGGGSTGRGLLLGVGK
jgi:hypothetical protein